MNEQDAGAAGLNDGFRDNDMAATELTFARLRKMDDTDLDARIEALLLVGLRQTSQREWEAILHELGRRDAKAATMRAEILTRRTEIFTRATTLHIMVAVWVAGTVALISVGVARPVAVVIMTLFFMYAAWQIRSEVMQVAPPRDEMQTDDQPFTTFLREVVDFFTPT
jgi:hypothetical protein